MNWKYLLLDFWTWVVNHGLTLAGAVVVGVLIPRVGRLIVRIVTERMTRGEEQTKSQLALVGALQPRHVLGPSWELVPLASARMGRPLCRPRPAQLQQPSGPPSSPCPAQVAQGERSHRKSRPRAW